MLAECRAAGDAVPVTVLARLHGLLQQLGAPTRFPAAFADAPRLWELARHDKKVRDGRVPMIVPTSLGHGTPVELTAAALARAIA